MYSGNSVYELLRTRYIDKEQMGNELTARSEAMPSLTRLSAIVVSVGLPVRDEPDLPCLPTKKIWKLISKDSTMVRRPTRACSTLRHSLL
jgi:hypothetical protein